MGRKTKYSFEMKIATVRAYENNESSQASIAKKYFVPASTFRNWWMIYQSQGVEGLQETHSNRRWDSTTKFAAVQEYLSGQGSLTEICKKHKISSDSILKDWIKVYNNHSKLKTTGKGERNTMIKARKTSFDERIEIVKFCVSHDKDYTLTMEKYQVSYQQIYLWVRKYEQNGVDGLVDRRGKSKAESDITDIDKLKAQNKLLQAEKERLEMEVNVLKKLAEVERRYR